MRLLNSCGARIGAGETEYGSQFVRKDDHCGFGGSRRVNFSRVLSLRDIDCYVRDPSLQFVARDDDPDRIVVF